MSKILNLTNKEASDIKFEVSSFPDGQQNIVLGSFKQDYHHYKGNGEYVSAFHPVTIKSRLNNWRDLELIACAVASLRELGVEEIHLYTPYIVGARSDRKFEEGGNNYLKDVICPVINSLGFKTVTCLDPHSDVLEACVKNFRKEDNKRLVNFALTNLYPGIRPSEQSFVLVSPDAGASKKIYKLAEQIGYKGDIITCSKKRDENGKLTKCVVPNLGFEFNKDIIIIDDICDGGATFINIAKEIKSQLEFHKASGYKNESKIYLIVTHGIFSKGFEELSKYFDGIYCTNSYGDPLTQRDGDVMYEKLVNTLNVF